MVNFVRKKVAFPRDKNQRGSALILSLLVTTVLLILLGAFLSMTISERGMTFRSYNSTAAINLAEAGIEVAIWELSYGGGDFLGSEGWSGTDPKTKSDTLQTSAGDTIGEYIVTVTDFAGTNPVIVATGYVPSQASVEGQRTVKITLEPDYLFTKSVFGIDGVSLDSNAYTDSYDSRLGLYGGGNIGSQGDIGTNAITTSPPAISLDSNATVNGDAIIGPGGDPATAIDTEGSSTITGQKIAAGSEVTLPSITAPTGLTPKGAINLGGSDSQVISSSGEYSSITLDGNSILTIDADATIYITGTLELDSNTQLIIANGADVEIYVDGWVYLDSNTQVNNLSQDPTKLALYGTDNLTNQPGGDPGIDFDSNALFYGTIYANNAGIVIDSNAQLFGSVLAKTVTLDSNATIHYDVALQGAGAPSSGYTVASWQEK